MSLTNEQIIERLNRKVPPTGQLLGQRVLEVDRENGRVLMEFAAKPEFCNPMGNVQGGIIAAMLDDAAAVAALVKAEARIVLPTLEFKVSFLAPAKVGRLLAEGQCIRLGRTIAFLEAKLMDESRKVLAIMTSTAMPVPAPEKPVFVTRD